MSFVLLREKLSREPSIELFFELCALFDDWIGDGVEIALTYAKEQLKDWEDEFRWSEDINWEQENPIWWPLVRSYAHVTDEETLPRAWHEQPALLRELTELCIVESEYLNDIDCLSHCDSLELLDLSGCGVEHLDGLSNCTNLRFLTLDGCHNLKSMDGLANCTKLSFLSLNDCRELRDCGSLAKLTNLEALHLEDCNRASLAGLANCINLETLNLNHCSVDLDIVGNLAKLRSLDVSHWWNLKDVRCLTNLTNLYALNLDGCDDLDVAPEKQTMRSKEEVQTYFKQIRAFYQT